MVKKQKKQKHFIDILSKNLTFWEICWFALCKMNDTTHNYEQRPRTAT